MAQDLQTASRNLLPAIDLQEPSSLLLVPQWLALQIKEVSDLGGGRTILDPETRAIIGQVATIPASMMPTGPQRNAIAQRIDDLDRAARPGPWNSTLVVLGELITEYASARLDEDTAAIKINAYRDAVEDLPSWAVREAVRRWRRGEVSGDTRDLDFAPRPARLRRIAEGIAATASGQAMRLRRILAAEPETPITEAQAAENQKRFVQAMKEAGVSSVEPTGSEAAERAEARRALAARFAEAEAQRRSKLSGEAA